MPRPRKCRRICRMPETRRFGPLDGREKSERAPVVMSVDEFETIRLIDWEGLNQEECAAGMCVARSTVQGMYNRARAKLAECLVQSRQLLVEGGDYRLCDGEPPRGACRHCRRERRQTEKIQRNQGEKTMRIAVPYENGQIFQHFGHTEAFRLYDVRDHQIEKAETVGTDGNGHGALAGLLRQWQADSLICGGIGGGAKQALAEASITVYGGVSGDADAAVRALLDGTLKFEEGATCHHHDEPGEEHSCGRHGEDGHSCR